MRKIFFVVTYVILLIPNCYCQTPKHDCNEKLKYYADNLRISDLGLEKNFSTDFKEFLSQNSNQCIESSKNYEYFISKILLKHYLFQIKTTHQGYNLGDEEGKYAKMIVLGYCKIAKIDTNREFINSGKIVDFVKKSSRIFKMPSIKSLIYEIEKEENKNIITEK